MADRTSLCCLRQVLRLFYISIRGQMMIKVDRHLFGLKKMLKQGEPIYAEPAFEQSSHGELNTSQLSISDGRVRV